MTRTTPSDGVIEQWPRVGGELVLKVYSAKFVEPLLLETKKGMSIYKCLSPGPNFIELLKHNKKLSITELCLP